MERTQGFTWVGSTNPGHQLNVVESGLVRIECNGRSYVLGRGDLVWYYEAEQEQLEVLEGPWVFYTINFIAPSLPPPDFEHRCIRLPRKESLAQFKTLLEAWRDVSAPHVVRAMRVQATLLQILADLITPSQRGIRIDSRTSIWWAVEMELRKDIGRSINMRTICQIAKFSRATVVRSCQQATGMPPLKRVKQMRMSMAHGLVILSNLTISEIAERVGYPRVHELSRDYHKYFGAAPTKHRAQYPKVYEREFGLPFTSKLPK